MSKQEHGIRIQQADIIALAASPSQYPPADLAEIAFAGRSNVGKSSLLNLLTGRKKLAHVSGSPGKTRTINFYDIKGTVPAMVDPAAADGTPEEATNGSGDPAEREAIRFRIVDLPGYGYAKVGKKMSEGWGEMMETYLTNRPNLVKVIQLIDIRHEPTKQDIQMYEFLKHYELDGLVAATKADKISRNKLHAQISLIKKTLAMGREDQVIPVSALKRTGNEELWESITALVRQ